MGYNRNLDKQNAARETRIVWPWIVCAVVLVGLTLASASTYIPKVNANETPLVEGTIITEIYWSDGDSGKANGHPFRLNNVDAPETGGVGAAIGGAKCEAERALGYEAKAFIVDETKDGELKVSGNLGQDRHGRWIVNISDSERDLGTLGKVKGFLRSWEHKGKKALEPRPKWCEAK